MAGEADVFDLIVVGSGPAGSCAARAASRAGLKVALVDQARFPRDKLCGGLLTRRAVSLYERVFTAPLDGVVQASSPELHLWGPQGWLNAARQGPVLRFTMRQAFDHHLFEQACAAGAVPFTGQPARLDPEAPEERPSVRLADGRQLSAHVVIGADGVRSAVARALFGRPFDPATIALAVEVELPRDAVDDRVEAPEVHFGYVRWGYGWVFPKRETLTVGVGGLLARNPDLRASLARLVRQRFGDVPLPRIKGHHIPYGDYRRRPGRGNVLLCGDAAGLVDPITGEGIGLALESGQAAAQAAVLACEARRRGDGTPAMAYYQPLARRWARDLDHARALRLLMFSSWTSAAFMRAIAVMQRSPDRHMALMAGEIDYPAYTRGVAGSILRRLGRLAFLPGPPRRAA